MLFSHAGNEENIAPVVATEKITKPLSFLQLGEKDPKLNVQNVVPSPRKVNMEKLESCDRKERSRSPLKLSDKLIKDGKT